MGVGLVYEVNLEVDRAVAGEYRAWLAGHVDQILALPGFVGAEVWDVVDPPPTAGRAGFSVRYLLHDQAALDGYLRDYAPAMRAEGLERWGERFRARRRVLRATADNG
jgi:hypothetical protein